jgi:hypothetical protein
VSLAVAEFMGSVSELALNISCIECSGPRIPELSKLLSGLKDSEDVTSFTNGVFRLVTRLIDGDFLQIAADRAVNDAKYRCPHSGDYNPNYTRKDYSSVAVSDNGNTISFVLGVIIVCASILFIVLSIVLISKFVVRRRHRKWVATLPDSHVRILHRYQSLKKADIVALDVSTVSMFRSDLIPVWIRISMPVIILGNIGLFLSGHLNIAASVSVMASLAGQTFQDEGLYQFSVANSTIEIWKGKFHPIEE